MRDGGPWKREKRKFPILWGKNEAAVLTTHVHPKKGDTVKIGYHVYLRSNLGANLQLNII